jgi:hypothetical protein
LDDAHLKEAIGFEFGTQGSFSGPGQPDCSMTGGANPRFWFNKQIVEKPTLHGKALLLKVRQLLRIGKGPQPINSCAICGCTETDACSDLTHPEMKFSTTCFWVRRPTAMQMGICSACSGGEGR